MAYVRTSGADPPEAAALGFLYYGWRRSQVLCLYIPCRFIYSRGLESCRGECWGGASRVLLSVAVLASLGLGWAVVGSDGVMDLGSCSRAVLCRDWWPRPVALLPFAVLVAFACGSFSHNVIRRVGGLCPYPHSFFTMSFAGLVASARIRTLFLLLGTLALPSRTAVLESWKAGCWWGLLRDSCSWRVVW